MARLLTRSRYITRAVAARSTPEADLRAGRSRTHAVDVKTGNPLCRTVRRESLLDDPHACDPTSAPTCPACIAALAVRFAECIPATRSACNTSDVTPEGADCGDCQEPYSMDRHGECQSAACRAKREG